MSKVGGPEEDSEEPEDTGGKLFSLNVTDVLGLGRVAKTAGAESILNALADLVQTRTKFTQNKTEADRRTRLSRAELEATKTDIETQELLKKASMRLGNQELRKQINLEAVSIQAIELANSDSDTSDVIEFDKNWFLSWSEGAQEADGELLREMWARMLHSATQNNKQKLPKYLLNLLSQLDGYIAGLFQTFLIANVTYRCSPIRTGLGTVTGLKTAELNLLEEFGLITMRHVPSLKFYWLTIGKDSDGGPMRNVSESIYSLTQRGVHLAEALYPKPYMQELSNATITTEMLGIEIAKFAIDFLKRDAFTSSFYITRVGPDEIEIKISAGKVDENLDAILTALEKVKVGHPHLEAAFNEFYQAKGSMTIN